MCRVLWLAWKMDSLCDLYSPSVPCSVRTQAYWRNADNWSTLSLNGWEKTCVMCLLRPLESRTSRPLLYTPGPLRRYLVSIIVSPFHLLKSYPSVGDRKITQRQKKEPDVSPHWYLECEALKAVRQTRGERTSERMGGRHRCLPPPKYCRCLRVSK